MSNDDAHFPSFSRRLAPVAALVATLVWCSSYDKHTPASLDFALFDKICHFFVFGLMGTLWFRFLPGELFNARRWLGALALTVAYGFVDEWIQSYNPSRSTDALDLVADTLGGLTAILTYRGWSGYRRLLERCVASFFQSRARQAI